jgi:hypothetical protein
VEGAGLQLVVVIVVVEIILCKLGLVLLDVPLELLLDDGEDSRFLNFAEGIPFWEMNHTDDLILAMSLY